MVTHSDYETDLLSHGCPRAAMSRVFGTRLSRRVVYQYHST